MPTNDLEDVDPMTILQPAPLGIGVYGYGGAGKTETALRLAFGIQRVYGGDVFYADTESRKGLAYRKMFPFRYIDFRAPHNALRYIDLIKMFAGRKGVLVIDTFTEEHDGEGGMIETQADAKDGKESRTAIAWALAKGQHKKLPRELRRALQTIPIIGTWRAEDKTDWNHKDERTGKVSPIPKGEMPIGSPDIPFEMTMHVLMRAGARGVPCLTPNTYGEDIMTKIPRWFDGLFKPGETITEEHGEALARWSMAEATPHRGRPAPTPAGPPVETPGTRILQRLTEARSGADLDQIAIDFKAALAERTIRKSEGEQIRLLAAARREALAGVVDPSAEPPQDGAS